MRCIADGVASRQQHTGVAVKDGDWVDDDGGMDMGMGMGCVCTHVNFCGRTKNWDINSTNVK